MAKHRRRTGLGALDKQQQTLLAVAAGALALYVLWPKSAKAETPAGSGAGTGTGSTGAPTAGGGMPGGNQQFTDPATGVLIDGPSTGIAPPAVGTQDTVRTVERGESWSNIASRSYGDYQWWPFLWDHNRANSTQFNDPDKLNRGDTIRIPPPPPNDPNFRSAIFARAQAHRNYWLQKNAGKGGSMPASVYERTPVPTSSMAGYRLGCMSGLGYGCGRRGY